MCDFQFDFALSFAGANRPLAEKIRDALKKNGFNVFYDRDFEHEMLGRDGYAYLQSIYSRLSRHCIVLISKEYGRSAWTNLEREFVRSGELGGSRAILIPVLTDGPPPDWLLSTRIYYDLRQRPFEQLIELLVRMRATNFDSPIPEQAEVRHLLSSIKLTNPKRRCEALSALLDYKAEYKTIAPEVGELLMGEKDSAVRYRAISLLGECVKFGDAGLNYLLLLAKCEENEKLRVLVSQQLSNVDRSGEAVVKSALRDLSRDGAIQVRLSAARALAKFGETDALVYLLEDRAIEVRVAAANYLAKRGKSTIDNLPNHAYQSFGTVAKHVLESWLLDQSDILHEDVLTLLNSLDAKKIRAICNIHNDTILSYLGRRNQRGRFCAQLLGRAGYLTPLFAVCRAQKACRTPDIVMFANSIVGLGETGQRFLKCIPYLFRKVHSYYLPTTTYSLSGTTSTSIESGDLMWIWDAIVSVISANCPNIAALRVRPTISSEEINTGHPSEIGEITTFIFLDRKDTVRILRDMQRAIAGKNGTAVEACRRCIERSIDYL